MRILIKQEPEAFGLSLPAYATPGSAGMDLCAAEDACLEPGQRGLVSTGLRMAIPVGFEAQIRPRSGLAVKLGLTCLNSPGTIDSDYRGIVKVLLINLGSESIAISRGDRIAQMIVAPVVQAQLELTNDDLDVTLRNEGGFGHTGTGGSGH
jgi:dUTP pyrophosphatase